MVTCPACERPSCVPETLTDGWRLCSTGSLAFRLNDKGELTGEWITTQREAPPGRAKPLSERVTFNLGDVARMKPASLTSPDAGSRSTTTTEKGDT